MTRAALLAALLALAGCGGGPLSLLTGGGPKVAANVPITAGRTAGQGVGVTTTTSTETRFAADGAGTVEQTQETAGTKVEGAERVTVNNAPDWWLWATVAALAAAAGAGWAAPSPGELARRRNDRREAQGRKNGLRSVG